jgi:hypothetical protein
MSYSHNLFGKHLMACWSLFSYRIKNRVVQESLIGEGDAQRRLGGYKGSALPRAEGVETETAQRKCGHPSAECAETGEL